VTPENTPNADGNSAPEGSGDNGDSPFNPGAGEPGWSEKPYVEPEPWHFAGWGHAENIQDLSDSEEGTASPSSILHTKLTEWRATAICGNDITSSVLYVTALCTLYAGVYAPLALAFVGLVLWIFRRIYEEVGSALPLNGGAYNVLLNTTSKYKASMAACLTILSYIATAVISATEAIHYFEHVVHGTPIIATTIALLGIFAFLNIIGITESSTVALGIFILHIGTLLVLVGFAVFEVIGDHSVLMDNLALISSDPGAAAPIPGGGDGGWVQPTLMTALFFGFSAALLGISGFESSANFIEEQDKGVFPKTLRNMWIAVFFFNVAVSLLSLGMIPVGDFPQYQTTLLSEMGTRSAGGWLGAWIGIDAVLVLSGAVLTSYVGVTGLVKRMSLDRCLPQFLLNENKWRGTTHWITLSFFALSVSILLFTEGDLEALAGVYTLSFLCVMGLFAVGNRLLAIKRDRLPRSAKASWVGVVVALSAVLIGIAGNVMKEDRNPLKETFGEAVGIHQAGIFLAYFAVTVLAVTIMFGRVRILRTLLYIGKAIHERVGSLNKAFSRWTLTRMDEINAQAIVFFTRGDSMANLRRAVEYVMDNEDTRNLKVVHVYDDEANIPTSLGTQLQTLDQVFPEIRIDFYAVQGRFGPGLIDHLSERLNVPRNYMFIGCPGDRFPHNLADLGGVRLIV
jgi:amino acid transporter